MIDFWASWCEPCKQSFPVMEELHKRYSVQGLVIIAINVDEKRPDMEAFLKKNTATFTVMRDPTKSSSRRPGIATIPSSFLIDRDGKVRFTHTGFRGAETRKNTRRQSNPCSSSFHMNTEILKFWRRLAIIAVSHRVPEREALATRHAR